jgi:hypothetical protein
MKKKTTEEFIKQAKEVHGDKYDYSKVLYEHSLKKVCIICPKHGEFWQIPNTHLQGKGCRKCVLETLTFNTKTFIEKAREIHGNKYDYSKVEYVNSQTKVCIICPKHGEFWQIPNAHLQGNGCLKCSYETRNDCKRLTTEQFIEKAREVHGDKYDYSKVKYINTHIPVCIICPKHGEFWQVPHFHLLGNGCRKCRQSKMEVEITKILTENNIKFIPECGASKFKWLGKLKYDFYLPQYNIAIECQGKQHFIPVKHFGGEKEFIKRKTQDNKKLKLSNKNGVKILYYANYKYDFPYDVILTTQELLKKIISE